MIGERPTGGTEAANAFAGTEFPAATLTRDPTALKEAARKSPVAITEYKRPRYVLMTYEKYLSLTVPAADVRQSLKTGAMTESLKKLALEALDQPYYPVGGPMFGAFW
jgi:hypothetical protein